MILNILITILGFFVLIYIESFLLALFGIRTFAILFFFFFKRTELKLLFVLTVIASLLFDVVYKTPLGSNIIILMIPFTLYLVTSLFVSLDSGVVPYLVKTFLFWLYYVSLNLLTNLFVSGEFGHFLPNDLFRAFLKAVVSVLILISLEYIYASLRKRGNTSQIQLK